MNKNSLKNFFTTKEKFAQISNQLTKLFLSAFSVTKYTAIIVLMSWSVISCSSSEVEQNYTTAVYRLKENNSILENHLKQLSNLNQETGLLQKKVMDSKTTNSKTALYFSQIKSTIITESKNLESLQKQMQIKLDEVENNLAPSLFKQKTDEINFLISRIQNNKTDNENTMEAIKQTILEINSIIKQKLIN